MQRFVTFFLASLFLSGFLSGCITQRSNHGYVVELGEKDVTADIGLDTKNSVLARYGEPSIRPALNDNTWYYIASRTSTRAYKPTQTDERRITAIVFDTEGSVTAIENYGIDDSFDIALVDRKTISRGKQLSFWEQLLGSVGQLPTTEGGDPNQP